MQCDLRVFRLQFGDSLSPEFLRKVGVKACDFEVHVPDPPYDEVSRNSLCLQFGDPSMTECVHSSIWNLQTLANDPKDMDIDIPVHQGSVVPRGKNQTCLPIAKMFFQHSVRLGVYVHVPEPLLCSRHSPRQESASLRHELHVHSGQGSSDASIGLYKFHLVW